MHYVILSHTTLDAVALAKLFLREVVRLHGLAMTIVSH